MYRITDLPDRPAVANFARRNRVGRATELALYAAGSAVTQAGWGDREFSILVGCSRGPTGNWEAGYEQFRQTGKVEARTSPRTTLGGIGFALADYFGTSALASGMSVTCSAGFHALLHGVALLRSGMAERVLVGGTEAPLTEFTLRQLEALRVTAPVPGRSEYACRPLDDPPSGMVLGEGAAFFALSGSPGPFELAGLSFAREAAGTATGITPEGAALQRTMRTCAETLGTPDCIVAHAPGTRRGDAAERAAVRAVFGEGGGPAVTSYKWATGHTFGASGPLGLDRLLADLERGAVTQLPYAKPTGSIRPAGSVKPTKRGMVNATGFGGNAVSIGVRKASD